jgi:protoporphyrinogen oxidase
MKNTVVVGAGFNGLVLARLLQKQMKKVVLIDAADKAGGLFGSWSYPKFGTYDRGIHIFQDTGVAEIETVIRGALPEPQWNILQGPRREIAGLFYNGRLQFNSAFLDLRDHVNKETLFGGMLPHLNQGIPNNDAEMSFTESITEKFGKPILDRVITPIVEGIYGKKVDELQLLASTLTPFHRVILFDEKNMLDLMQSEVIRARCAYPEQRLLPERYSSGLVSYYPKQFGLQKIIDSLLADFVRDGGALHLGSSITSFYGKSRRLTGIRLENSTGGAVIENIDRCIWTAAMPTLYKALLGHQSPLLHYDLPLQTWILNLSLMEKPKMEDLYFFYSYLTNGNIFRVSNPLAYCEEHEGPHNGYYPLCVEAIFPFNSELSQEEIKIKLVEELVQMRIFKKEVVCFMELIPLPAGLPMPTLKNLEAIAIMRSRLEQDGFDNIIPVGIQAESGLFYYRDVLRYGYSKTF